MRNATTGTCNGASPKDFDASGGGFFATWEMSSMFYTCALSALTNCFSVYVLSFEPGNWGNTMTGGPAGSCCPTFLPFPVTCADVKYTINGVEFTAHTENFGFGPDVTPPTFIFS
jgi:hypothetical protein